MRSQRDAEAEGWLLALHSSSEVLGVGLQRLGAEQPERLEAFPLGRALSNRLFDCVESVLPASACVRESESGSWCNIVFNCKFCYITTIINPKNV